MGSGAILGQTGANRQLSNLSNVEKALNNIGAGVRQNIFINPFFKVNQRGSSSYSISGPVYTLDCWKSSGTTSSGTISLSNNTIQLTNSNGTMGISQLIEEYSNLAGKTVTVSFLAQITSGQYRIVINDGTQNTSSNFSAGGLTLYSFTDTISNSPSQLQCAFESVNNGNATIYAAKLEIGGQQTLAYQDTNGDWQLLEQPDPNEILKCYRYQYVPDRNNSTVNPSGFGYTYSGNARVLVPTQVPMRANPSVTYLSGDLSGINISASDISGSPTNLSGATAQSNGVLVVFSMSGVSNNKPCVMRFTGAKLLFDANL